MRKKNKQKQSDKMCPFLEENCIKEDCEIYVEMLNRCSIPVLPYNLYRLTQVMGPQLDDNDY